MSSHPLRGRRHRGPSMGHVIAAREERERRAAVSRCAAEMYHVLRWLEEEARDLHHFEGKYDSDMDALEYWSRVVQWVSAAAKAWDRLTIHPGSHGDDPLLAVDRVREVCDRWGVYHHLGLIDDGQGDPWRLTIADLGHRFPDFTASKGAPDAT